jgi:hypothetical protein
LFLWRSSWRRFRWKTWRSLLIPVTVL